MNIAHAVTGIHGHDGEPTSQRCLATAGKPLLLTDWVRVLFIHFEIAPEILRPHLPMEPELFHGKAVVSLVAVTMRRFRRPPGGSPVAWLFRPLAEQRFLNLRTYVRHRGEPGAFFFRGWLSRPLPVPMPSGLFGLSYQFVDVDYRHHHETGELNGAVTAGPQCFRYAGRLAPSARFQPGATGSLDEFALERYTAFFQRGSEIQRFRVEHPAWPQVPVDIAVEDDRLVAGTFPWFKSARQIGANYSPGFPGVVIGRPCRLEHGGALALPRRRIHCAFFEMP